MKVPPHALEMEKFYTWMDEYGICRTKTKPSAEIELFHAQENSRAVNSFYSGHKFPLLIDARPVKSISQEARKHFSTNGRETYTNAFGFLVRSPLSRVIGNFFIGINKPPLPTRLFDHEPDAVAWLKQFVAHDQPS